MFFSFAKGMRMPTTEIINTKDPLPFLNYSETNLLRSDSIKYINKERNSNIESHFKSQNTHFNYFQIATWKIFQESIYKFLMKFFNG